MFNLGTSLTTVTVNYVLLDGSLAYTQSIDVAAQQSTLVNLADITQLGASFKGSVAVTSPDQALSGTADISQTSCVIPSNVQISRDPTGDLHPGDTVLFTASADGTAPFTYQWSVGNVNEGGNSSTLSHAFSQAGDATLGVILSNGCGQASASLPVTIKPLVPDLSASLLTVDHLSIFQLPAQLNYTITVNNDCQVAANASLNNPVPAHSTYVVGSGSSSDGNSVSLAGNAITWSGTVTKGHPIMIQFSLAVTDLPVGGLISDSATLMDGFGGATPLNIESPYKPGYSLSINNSAVYINQLAVNLSYTWDSLVDVTTYCLSNDGGFGPAGNTVCDLSVDKIHPTHAWTLTTLDNTIISRTVYIKFFDKSGNSYEPYTDDIIFDTTPPTITQVKIFISNGYSPQDLPATIQVTFSDDLSGVNQVQVSNQPGFNSSVEFSVQSQVANIPWTLQPSGKVYVRVADRAGNLSTIDSAQGPTSQVKVSLPIIYK